MSSIKLTKLQKKVIKDLRDGMSVITSSEVKGAWISGPRSMNREDYHIDNGVFWRLVNKGLIRQGLGGFNDNFDYRLTELGKKVKL
jgi:hypothetical protein